MKIDTKDLNTLLDCYFSCLEDDPTIIEIQTYRDSKDNYDIVSPLARGSYGDVFIVKHKKTSKLFAMKRLSKQKVKRHPNTALFFYERDCLVDCRSLKYSAYLVSSFQDTYHLYLVMEFCEGGDLLSVLAKLDVLPENYVLFYFCEILLALEELHENMYIHRDIKPDNILITKNGHIKLADFGSCTKVDPVTKLVESRHPVGTPDYISPEVLESTNTEQKYGFEVDVWSLGVVVYEMLNGYTPFSSNSLSGTYKKITKIEYNNENGSEKMRKMIECMICEKSKRYTLKELKKLIIEEFNIDFDNIVPPFVPESDWNVNFGDMGFVDDEEAIKVGYKGFIGFSYDDNAKIISNIQDLDQNSQSFDFDNKTVKKVKNEIFKLENVNKIIDKNIILESSQVLEKEKNKSDKESENKEIKEKEDISEIAEKFEKEEITEKLRNSEKILTGNKIQKEHNIIENSSSKAETISSNFSTQKNSNISFKSSSDTKDISAMKIGEIKQIKESIFIENKKGTLRLNDEEIDKAKKIEEIKMKQKKFKQNISLLRKREHLWRIKMYLDQLIHQRDLISSLSEQLLRENILLKKEIRKKESQMDFSNQKKVDEMKKELRQYKNEVREHQQKEEYNILTVKKLQDEISYLKMKLEDSNKLVKTNFRILPIQKKEFGCKSLIFESGDVKSNKHELVDVNIVITEEYFKINDEEFSILNLYYMELKENELYFLGERKKNLVVKIAILDPNMRASTNISSCKSSDELLNELKKEEQILGGIEKMLKIIPKETAHYETVEKQKIGTLKKISQIKKDLKSRNTNGSLMSNNGEEKNIKENIDNRLNKMTLKSTKMLEFNNHRFVKKTFQNEQTCIHCNAFLCGTYEQGLECIDCKIIVHNWCHVLVEESCELYRQIKHGKTYFLMMKSIEEREKIVKVLKSIC